MHAGRPQTAVRMLVLFALAAPAARADIIHFKDGRRLEGRIVARTATELTVESSFGTLKVDLAKIARIEEKRTPAEEVEARRAALRDDDVDGLLELSDWAAEQGLTKHRQALLRDVLAVDPEHPLANELLGRVRLDGRWMDPDELAAWVAEHAAARRAEGLIYDDGAWRSEDEVMRRRGLVRHGDEWLPPRTAETRAALDALPLIFGSPVQATESGRFTLFASLPEDATAALRLGLERAEALFLEALPPDEETGARLQASWVPILLPPDAAAMQRLHEPGFIERYPLAHAQRERWRSRTNYALLWPQSLIVVVAEGDHVLHTGHPTEARLGLLVHHYARILVQQSFGSRPIPGWLEGAWTTRLEGRVNRYATISMGSAPVDEGGRPVEPFVPGWEDYTAWVNVLSDERRQAEIPDLREVLRQPLSRLDSRELAVCWSFLDYLLSSRSAELRLYVAAYGRDADADRRDPSVLHDAAFAEAFATSSTEVESAWRAWAASQPPVLDYGRR